MPETVPEGLTITRHALDDHGEYRATVPGIAGMARLTWVTNGPDRIAEHTLVPEPLAGRGIAGKLVEALIADARREGFHIVPSCSYVAAAFARHPEWADLKA
jgi:predicted GNAT family acetyltransferase